MTGTASRRVFGFLAAISVAALPALAQPIVAASASTGTLFAITGDQHLVKVDPATGAFTILTDLNNANNPQSSDLADDPVAHRLYAERLSATIGPDGFPIFSQDLLTIDSSSGAILADPQLNAPPSHGLVVDPSTGTLFGFDGLNVVTIDPGTAAVRTFANIASFGGPFIDSLVGDASSHTLFLSREDVSGPVGTNTTKIFSINTTDGSVSIGPVLDRPISQITVDAGNLYGVSNGSTFDFVAINNTSGATTLVTNIADNSSIVQGGIATDSASHTTFVDVESQNPPGSFIYQDHLLSTNDISGATTSRVIATALAPDGMAFEPSGAPADTSPPATSAALLPAPNSAGWNRTNVTLSLSATDPDGVADVAAVHYSAAGAQPIAATSVAGSSASIVLTAEGVTTVAYFAVDNAGNTEAPHAQVVRIDKTLPTITYTGNAGTYTVDQAVAITCTALDPANANGTPGSGLASNTCANASGPAYSFPLGPNSLTASATDIAGNIGNGSAAFTVEVTDSSLCNLTKQFIESSPAFLASPAQGQTQEVRLCELLAAAGSAGGPAKTALIASYQKGLTPVVNMGFLSAAQAAILLRLSQAL